MVGYGGGKSVHPLSLCLYPFKRGRALYLLSAFSFDHSSLSQRAGLSVATILPSERIERSILLVPGTRSADADLAALYAWRYYCCYRLQTAEAVDIPYVFTEQGVAMLSTEEY